MSFLTGYKMKTKNGLKTIMNPRKIAIRYLKGTFILDAIAVLPDWFFTTMKVVLHAEMSGDNVSKLVRIVRIIRIYRLLKIQKLRRLWYTIKDKIESDYVFVIPTICQIMVFLLLMSHFIGSAWYLVGVIGMGENTRNWIEKRGIRQDTLFYRYTTSVQWALSNFVLYPSEVYATNAGERVYAIFCQLLGVVVFFCCTSSVYTCLMEMKNMRSESSKEFWLLRRYLRQHDVPATLASRILIYAEATCKQDLELVAEHKVALIQLLSDNLISELKCAVNFAKLFAHPLMDQCRAKTHITLGLASQALKKKPYAPDDTVFSEGVVANNFFLVTAGELVYGRPKFNDMACKDGTWLCESALWVSWSHRGNAIAMEPAQLILCNSHAFVQVIMDDPLMWNMMALYCVKYVEWLNESDFESLNDVCYGAKQQQGFVDTLLQDQIDAQRKVNRFTFAVGND